jgi:hypothetical protein
MKKLLLFVCLCLPFFTGCAASPLMLVSPIVTGVIMWKEGEAHKYYNEEAHTLYRATKIALKELDHPITKDESNKDGGYYIVAGQGDKFHIVIRQVKPHITEVRCRINFMGDKPYAELLYRQIDSNTNTIDFDDQGKPTKRKLRK